jgi:ATP-dependent Clp protease ATP-binding subunit ClpC
MFERFTETMRRAIYYSRYEASDAGSLYIEPEYLLLGLFRASADTQAGTTDAEEAKLSLIGFFPVAPKERGEALRYFDQIWQEIQTTIKNEPPKRRDTLPPAADLPLAYESKRIIAYTLEETELAKQKHSGVGHCIAGFLREKEYFASKIIQNYGVELSRVREQIVETSSVHVLLLTPNSEARKILTDATEAAGGSGKIITPAHFLVGLLKDPECRSILESIGAQPERITEILETLSPQRPRTPSVQPQPHAPDITG